MKTPIRPLQQSWLFGKRDKPKAALPILILFSFFLFFLLICSDAAAITKTSTGSGNWNTAGSWSPGGAPAAGDDVIIAAGHTITVNVNTSNINSLTINGTLTIGNNNTNRTVTVSGNITVNTGGVFNTAGNGDNEINIGGNLLNNGTFDMNIGGADADVFFNGNANQTISGTGATTDFNGITINNTGAANNNIVEILPSNFSAAAGFLALTRGIIKMSGSYTFSNTFFSSANPNIHSDEGIWLNNTNVTVTGQNGDTQLSGLLRITAGTYNVGVGADWWLNYYTGSQIIIEGGALNITGALCGGSTTETTTYTQSAGTVIVNTVGNNYSVGSFDLRATGSVFTMSGGNIIMQIAASSYTDYVNYSSTSTVTGGKIQAGNALTPLSAVFWMNSTAPLYDLEINLTNNPLFQLRAATTVLHDITINGILDAATQNVSLNVGRNWTNNGVFLPGSSAPVTFNGTSPQVIGGLLPTTFGNLVFNNTGGGVALNTATSVSGAATFTAGIVTTSATNILSFLDNASTTGANNNLLHPSFVNGPVRKTGNDAFTFPVGKSGAGFHPCSISAPALITDIFTAEYMRANAAALGSITAAGLYHVSGCDYWNIDRTLGLSSVNVTLSWNGQSNCNTAAYVNDLPSLVVAHFNGTNWNSYGANSYTGNASSGTITWNNVSVFSPFSLGSNNAATNPLPVKFAAVKAYPVGNDNRIEWTNQTESGVDRYIVEKSVDGISFTDISTINPRSNNNTKEEYSETDTNVNDQTTWYRIRAIEYAGNTIYSPVIKVTRDARNDMHLSLYPNPVTGKQFVLQLNSAGRTIYSIQLYDASGRQVFNTTWQHNGGAASRTVELPATISPGMYMVNVTDGDRNFTSKLIVQ